MKSGYGYECSMCGRPMDYRHCGMCVSCEQIDNDVPDYNVMDYSVDGTCPQCGLELDTEETGGECGEHFQYCKGENCNWTSVNLYDG
jgi:predicted amidophosphoribosyltransferase